MKLQHKLYIIFITLSLLSQYVLAQEYVEDITTEEPTTATDETTTTNDTTTTPPTTTTPSTTTMAPTTPPPKLYHFYNITDENNVTCIMIDGVFSFLVTYSTGGNKTNETHVVVPKPSDDVLVEGSCNSTDPAYKGTQHIKILWGNSVPRSSIVMRFNMSSDLKSWSLMTFSSVIYLDKDIFINSTDTGKSLNNKIDFVLAPHEIAVNHSFKCFTKFEVKNITSLIENITYLYPVHLTIDGIQLQAFNQIASTNRFGDEIHCAADKIADIVPIAVGCALAGLIIIVLIAYIVGRRRRSAAYQSV